MNERNFITPYARIGPFLTSYCRYFLSKLLANHMESIVYIHTDGFISTKPIPSLQISDGLGKFKVKNEGGAVIYNEQKVQWMGKANV